MALKAFVVAIGLLLSGCEGCSILKADRMERAWQRVRPERYTLIYQGGCGEGPGPYDWEVDVTGTVIDTVRYDTEHTSDDYDEVVSRAVTVDMLFDTVRDVVVNTDRAGVTYNKEWHYPDYIAINHHLSNEDQNCTYRVEEFVPVAP